MRRDRQDYRQVAQLHVDCLNQGFLSTLGTDFLSLMYECIDEDPTATLLTCERDGEIVGFITSSGSLRSVYIRMLGHTWRLIASIAPSLLSQRRLLRVLEILRYGAVATSTGVSLPKAELLSLAVASEWRGTGCAEELYQRLVTTLAKAREPAFKIVVGAALAPAHRFYQRMGALPAAQIEVHAGEASTVYVHTIS